MTVFDREHVLSYGIFLVSLAIAGALTLGLFFLIDALIGLIHLI